jgi:hypothetical protein
MAIYIEGETRCMICGEAINERSDAILFPSFVMNEKDPLYVFNDAVVHETCFKNHQDANKASRMYRIDPRLLDIAPVF